MDWVIRGTIWTGERFVHALHIQGNTIVGVYPQKEGAEKSAGESMGGASTSHVGSSVSNNLVLPPDAELVEVPVGGVCIPGLVDHHSHVYEGAMMKHYIDLADKSTPGEIMEALHDAGTVDGEWIVGANVDDASCLTSNPRQMLNAVSECPVAVMAADLHTVWLNSAALNALEAKTAGFPLQCHHSNLSIGVFYENDVCLVEQHVLPKISSAEKCGLLIAVIDQLLRYGVTKIEEMMGQEDNFRTWRTLEEQGHLRIRVDCAQGSINRQTEDDLRFLAAECRRQSEHCVLFRHGPIKLFYDGVMENNTAATSFSPSPLPNASVTKSLCADFDVAIHANGNLAVHQAIVDTRESPHLVRIEHLELVNDEDLDEMAARGITASMQPSHCPPCTLGALHCALRMTPCAAPWHAVVPSSLWRNAWPWPRIIRMARIATCSNTIPLMFGSDWPIGALNPWESISAAVRSIPWRAAVADDDAPACASSTREPCWHDSRREHGSGANEAAGSSSKGDDDGLSVADALRAFSPCGLTGRAKGALELGAVCDCAILNVNVLKVPLDEWGEVRSVMTCVNGVRYHF